MGGLELPDQAELLETEGPIQARPCCRRLEHHGRCAGLRGATTGMRRLNIDQVRLEYRFLQKFQLTTVYGDANVGSIDLSWTKRF